MSSIEFSVLLIKLLMKWFSCLVLFLAAVVLKSSELWISSCSIFCWNRSCSARLSWTLCTLSLPKGRKSPSVRSWRSSELLVGFKEAGSSLSGFCLMGWWRGVLVWRVSVICWFESSLMKVKRGKKNYCVLCVCYVFSFLLKVFYSRFPYKENNCIYPRNLLEYLNFKILLLHYS